MTASREDLDKYVTYGFDGPRLNMDVPPSGIKMGELSRCSGIDGRFPGCLKKYYGNRLVVDLSTVSGLSGIGTYTGLVWFQEVVFQKRATSTVYRGFVIAWDKSNDTANLEVGLAYTADGGTTWTYLQIWAGGSSSVSTTTPIEAATDRGYCMVAAQGKSPQTIYWTGSAVTVVDSGPGSFAATLAAMTVASQSKDTSYHLTGSGVYQVRYRFYSSTRGIYSAMSSAVTVYMDLPTLAKARGAIYFSVYGGDSGLMISGDVITVNGRTFKYIAGGGDVTIAAASAATSAAHAQALADAINSDTATCGCTATAESAAVFIEAVAEGTTGNTYTLSVTETGASTDDLSVSGSNLTGGGESTTEYAAQCKAVLNLPDDNAVVSGKVYADFAAIFDTLDIFRTIDLGKTAAAQEGAIFYREQSITKAASWNTDGAWDALTVSIGTLVDTALAMSDDYYDPAKDSIVAPPQSGAIARYQGSTLMGASPTATDPYSILTSSMSHVSMEYFSTYNERLGVPDRGVPIRFLKAGDSAFALHPGGFTHVYKSTGTGSLQFVDTIEGPGLDGKYACHTFGNSVLMISAGLPRIMGGNDGNISDISGTARLMALWTNNVEYYVSSGYDGAMNCSMFLNSQRAEILCIWHGTSGLSLIEGADFTWLTSGPDISGGKKKRIYLATAKGRVVSPDVSAAGSGSMFDLSASLTLMGSATGGSTTTLECTGATFSNALIGARVYMLEGDNAGDWARVLSVAGTTLTFEAATAFDNAPAYGDRFCINPVPFYVQLPRLAVMDAPGALVEFDRHKMYGMKAGFDEITVTTGLSDQARIGAVRGSGLVPETIWGLMKVTGSVADAAGSLSEPIDGIDVMPTIEYFGVGSSWELTSVQVTFEATETKEVAE